MASAKIYFQMDVSLPGGVRQTIGDKSSPVVVTLDSTAPEYFQDRVYINNGSLSEILSIGSGDNIAGLKVLAVKPSVNMMISWKPGGGGDDEDSSVIEVRANMWTYLSENSTYDYDAVFLDRIAATNTPDDIGFVYATNDSGSNGYIDVVAVY